MATEDDKTNTGIAGTAIAVGVAAMIAGSSAIVGMARTEVAAVSADTHAYADLNSVKALNGEHAQRLTSAKLPIDKARQQALAELKRDPEGASPWTPKGAPLEAPTEATTGGAPDPSAVPSASDAPAEAPSGAAQEATPSAAEAAPSAPGTAAEPAPTH